MRAELDRGTMSPAIRRERVLGGHEDRNMRQRKRTKADRQRSNQAEVHRSDEVEGAVVGASVRWDSLKRAEVAPRVQIHGYKAAWPLTVERVDHPRARENVRRNRAD